MVKFIEDSHSYLTHEGEKLISVSSLTDLFKVKKDFTEIAKNYAKKLTKSGTPMTQQDVLDMWAAKANQSKLAGTAYHKHREAELINSGVINFNDLELKVKTQHLNLSDSLGHKLSIPIDQLENNCAYPELMIYDLEFGVCGQSDLVIIDQDRINILDYKTDEELKFKSFSSQWVKPTKFIGPISHLDQCNVNEYSLKMSMYLYLLWRANKGRLKPGDIIIEHIELKRDPMNNNHVILNDDGLPIELSRKRIKLPYRRKEVVEMLKFYQNDWKAIHN